MKVRPRRMKKYTPRRRRSNKELQKQQLKDFEHLLEMDLSSFLILSDEGTAKQMEAAKAKMRSDLLKYGSDMETIGRDLGQGFPEIIREYIKSMMLISKNANGKIDPSMINTHRQKANQLKKNAA